MVSLGYNGIRYEKMQKEHLPIFTDEQVLFFYSCTREHTRMNAPPII